MRDSNAILEFALGSLGQDPNHESLWIAPNEQLRLGRHMADWRCLSDVKAKELAISYQDCCWHVCSSLATGPRKHILLH